MHSLEFLNSALRYKAGPKRCNPPPPARMHAHALWLQKYKRPELCTNTLKESRAFFWMLVSHVINNHICWRGWGDTDKSYSPDHNRELLGELHIPLCILAAIELPHKSKYFSSKNSKAFSLCLHVRFLPLPSLSLSPFCICFPRFPLPLSGACPIALFINCCNFRGAGNFLDFYQSVRFKWRNLINLLLQSKTASKNAGKIITIHLRK